MNYEITAIPTIYKGIQFRSRLEARWAAFFDLAGFNWEYEPIDFSGWIPDFLLVDYRDLGVTKIFIEVKPVDRPDNDKFIKALKYNKKLKDLEEEINEAAVRKSLEDGEYFETIRVMCVGRTPLIDMRLQTRDENVPKSFGYNYSAQFFWFKKYQNKSRLDIAWIEENGEASLGKGHLGFSSREYEMALANAEHSLKLVELLWNEAGNIVQYRRPPDKTK